ncbi:MAG TPA: IS4 family transposase [Candidatus Binatia bacterium]|nr:IS4 family transposase [Candidatus Binatia bacterium]
MSIPKAPVLFDLFDKAVPPQFFDQLRERLNLPARGIYSLAVVVWLMMWQRLEGRGTLAMAVQQVVQGVLGDLLPSEKRVRERRVSSNTGGLSRARKRLPVAAVEAVSDEIFRKLTAPAELGMGLRSRLFLMDGSSMRLPHTPSLAAAYPPGSNKHGAAHWPVIRVLVAHHLVSGLSTRPCWGPMYGAQAVSEQGLAEQIMRRLPAEAVLLADRNFAVFSVVWAAQQNGCGVLFRITEERARKIAGGFLPPANSERRVVWRPSRDDQRAHPELPAEAVVRGRLLVAHVEGEDGRSFKLCLFTTLEEPREELVELYRRRWDIELDIRSLKQTLQMHSLNSKSPEMMEKELLLAIAGYNLVRSVQMAAARQANLEPRRLSFSRVQAVVMTALPRLATTTDAAQWETEYQQVLRWAAQGKLPNRPGRRSYPRAIWGRGGTFPRHERNRQKSGTDEQGGQSK